MKSSKLFAFALIAFAAVMCSTPEIDAQGRGGQERNAQGQGRGGQGRGGQGRGGQGRGFGGRGGGTTSLLGLCSMEAVQKEIDLVDEQKADLDKLRASQRESRGSRTGGVDFRALRDLPEEERNAKIAEMREKSAADRAKREKEENAKVAEILLPPQLARVKEIRIQMMGLRALGDKEVIEKLVITTAQQKQIKEIPEKAQEESRAEMREAFSNLRDLSREERTAAFAKFREKAESQQKETEKKVLAVLTSKQKTDFAAMKGAPFKMPERQAGQRGNSGRGQQGRGTQGRGQGRGTSGRGGEGQPSRGTQGRGTGGRGSAAPPSRGTQGRDNPAPKKDDN